MFQHGNDDNVLFAATVSEYEHMTCKREFNKIGCFDEYNAKKGELLVDYRAHVKWMSIADFLHRYVMIIIINVGKGAGRPRPIKPWLSMIANLV